MAEQVTILGIAGSLRKNSYNRAALKAAQQLAPAGVTIDIFEIDGIPLFNQDEEKNLPPKVQELKTRVRAADALLIVTPEYNYSIPGVMKNVFDWGSRPHGDNAWANKIVALMSASPGMFGGARAQYHLRQVLLALNMHALNQPEIMISNAAQKFDAAGQLTDEKTVELIRKLLQVLVQRAGANKHG